MNIRNEKLALIVSMTVICTGTASMSTGAWAICQGKSPSIGCTVNGAVNPLNQCAPVGTGPQTIAAPIGGCVDPVTGLGGCVIEGGNGDDVLIGSLQEDTICAGDGTDFVFAQAGDDAVFMGPNPDSRESAYGQFGNDILNGEEGADSLAGGPGPDTNNGGPGNDFCFEAQSTNGCEIILSPNP